MNQSEVKLYGEVLLIYHQKARTKRNESSELHDEAPEEWNDRSNSATTNILTNYRSQKER